MGLEAITKLNFRGEVKSAFQSYKDSMKGERYKGGKGALVLGGRVSGLIAHILAHLREGGRPRPYKGVPGGLTIIDDPIVKGSLSFYIYDDEGIPAVPRILYKNGAGKELLLNRVLSASMGLTNNGSAVSSYRMPPKVRPSTTYVIPTGDKMSREELLEFVGKGIYVGDYANYFYSNGKIILRCVNSRIIDRGELTKYLRFPVITIDLDEFLRSNLTSKTQKFKHDLCKVDGEGRYVWFGGPDVALLRSS